jgi:hypothetical protein
MTDNNFQPIFDYTDESNSRLKEDILTEVRGEFFDIKTSLANLAGQIKKYHEEMLVSGHRIDRLEQWADQVGKKVGIPISF